MKKILRAIGFGRADEMEKSIQLKSMRFAWVYTMFFLLVWSLYEINSGSENFLPAILFLSQNLIMLFSRLLLMGRMTGGVDEEEEKPQAKQTSILAKLARIDDMASPKVVSVVMIIVIIIMVVRFLMGW